MINDVLSQATNSLHGGDIWARTSFRVKKRGYNRLLGRMNMKTRIISLSGMLLFLLSIASFAGGQDKATPQEVIQKVREAANTLSKSGESGLPQFNQESGPWVWKDTYIFVFDCPKGTIAAHPVRHDLVGKDARTLKGARGTEFFPKLCEATNNPSGVWVEYWWPKPGEKEASRKVSYAIKAGNTPYIVGAGIYDDKTSVADLQKLTGEDK
jgi:cytochrome c